MANELDIVIITAKQHPRPPGFNPQPSWVPKCDFVIVDYIGILDNASARPR